MKKILTIAAVLALGVGAAQAADLRKVYTKAPPPPVEVSPWDFAFGAGIASDYIFRGITQSAHKPSVNAYFEPRYNINPNLQLYAGLGGASISFPNRAAAEIDVYGGIRPTFGPVAFDFGVFGYLYPGGQCFHANPAFCGGFVGNGALPNGNFAKRDWSFFEGYGKVLWTVNDWVAVGANAYYSPNFLNTGADGTYVSGTAKFTAPSTWFGSTGIGAYLSGEYGHQFFGTSDAFYGNLNYRGYNTWNVGLGFTYKVFTLDLRYHDTDYGRGNCNAFTSDHTTFTTGAITAINPAPGLASNWCSSAYVAKFSADLTALSNLK